MEYLYILFMTATVIVLWLIKGRLKIMGNAVDNLKKAVDDSATTTTDGFAKLESAFAELADDISKIPDAANVQAEADRISKNTAEVGVSFGALAQRLRDAVPTDAPTEPLPPATTETTEVTE